MSRPCLRRASACALLFAPALLLATLDFLCRLHLASLLELDHDPAARAAALHAAVLGVAKDLFFVLPAYAVFALAPRPATLRLAHAAFAIAAAILAVDVVYFYITLEHVEPVLFVNLNRHAIRGTLTPQSALLVAAGAVGLWALSRVNGRLLARAGRSRPSRWALALLAAAWIAAGVPLVAAARAEMPRAERPLDRFLNESRNAYLEKVSAPIVGNLFAVIARSVSLERSRPRRAFEAYSPDERSVLEDLALLAADSPVPETAPGRIPEIRRIALLILESLPAAYLHHYNPRVPKEATPFLDELVSRYPHSDRFFTSNMPSDWGLNSMFLSRLRPDWAGGRESLLSVLRDSLGFESYYVRGVSKHYGNELVTYTRLFQMDHYYAFEELDERYDAPWRSSWGFNNEVVYHEGIRILRENRDRKVFVVLKTIDLHQPGPFQGFPREHLPEELQRRNVGLFNALHWADHCLRTFFEKLEKERLFDDHTLVIVTSDHTPQPGVEYRETVPPDEYRRLGRLPLIFVTRDPGALRDLDTAGFASQVDLAPTVLDILGVPKPPGFVGRSLFGADPQRFSVGVYRDTFYYGSEAQSFTEVVSDAAPAPTLRSRAIRKWLRNLDASGDAGRAATPAPRARRRADPRGDGHRRPLRPPASRSSAWRHPDSGG
ncbi:MAG: sulfatase-like hydrolase/transferase [Myxococcales bacterium]|nr:sulfatase-like hydrolase/transferase [Myxococcales bacterium]